MNLAQFPVGQTARVLALATASDLTQRLAALGLRADSEVTVLRRGCFGGPLQLRVGGTELMLRRDAAQSISVVALGATVLVSAALDAAGAML